LNKGLNSACAKVSAFAETIPAVTVDNYTDFHRQNPFANFTESEFPKVVYGSVSLASIFSKAISIFESVPMSFAVRLFIV
jgi:hypothetical protein